MGVVVRDDNGQDSPAHYALEEIDDVAHFLRWLAQITAKGEMNAREGMAA